MVQIFPTASEMIISLQEQEKCGLKERQQQKPWVFKFKLIFKVG